MSEETEQHNLEHEASIKTGDEFDDNATQHCSVSQTGSDTQSEDSNDADNKFDSVIRPDSISTFRSSASAIDNSPPSGKTNASLYASLEAENEMLRKRIELLENKLLEIGVDPESVCSNELLASESSDSFRFGAGYENTNGGGAGAAGTGGGLKRLSHLSFRSFSQGIARHHSGRGLSEKESTTKSKRSKAEQSTTSTTEDDQMLLGFQHRRSQLRQERSVERQASIRLLQVETTNTPNCEEGLTEFHNTEQKGEDTENGSDEPPLVAKHSDDVLRLKSEGSDGAPQTLTKTESGNYLLHVTPFMKTVSKAALDYAASSTVPVCQLPRGGVHIQTSKGAIQFGIPPETIKDCMMSGLEIPQYYIVPKDRFNLKLGINMCEAEFPVYFNFFIRQVRMNLVSTPAVGKIVRSIIVETLEGPEEKFLYVDQEYAQNAPLSGRYSFAARPDHLKEINYFKEPRNGRTISADTAVGFIDFLPYPEQVEKLSDEAKRIVQDIISQGPKNYRKLSAASTYGDLAPHCKTPHTSSANNGGQSRGNGTDETAENITDNDDYREGDGESDGGDGPLNEASLTHSPQQDISGQVENSILVAILGNGLEIIDEGDEYIVLDDGKQIAQIKSFLSSWAPPQQLSVTTPGFIVEPPAFGITVLGSSHGFDSNGSTSGFVLWINRKGIMVDPPPNATEYLQQSGIVPNMINGIILTHCHADHDAGTFQKILKEGKTTLITTKTIYESFIRKYSLISGFEEAFLQLLFESRLVKIGEDVHWGGGTLRFFYSLHALPCIGFEVMVAGKRFTYSSDTFYDPEGLVALRDKNYLSNARCDALLNFPWDCDVIVHEAGIPPIHTPMKALSALPEDVKKRLYIIHIATASAEGSEFKLARAGVDNTIEIPISTYEYATSAAILQLLRSTDIFRHFSISQASDLLQLCRHQIYKAGEYVCKAGDLGDRFFVVLSGFCRVQFPEGFGVNASLDLHKEQRDEIRAGQTLQLKVHQISRKASGNSAIASVLSNMGTSESSLMSGEEEIVNHTKEFGPGDYFGELALLSDDRRRSADVIATTNLTLIELDSHAFRYLLDTTPGLEYRMERLSRIRCSLSWKAIGANSVLSRLRSTQRSQLQSVLQVQHVSAGTRLWTKGKPATCAYLLAGGKLEVLEMRDTMGDPFRAGAFFCNIASLMSHRQVNQSLNSNQEKDDRKFSRSKMKLKVVSSRITLVAKTDADLYYIEADDVLEFLDSNPGVFINLIDSIVME